MPLKLHKDIQSELDLLNCRDQYVLLLQTKEWDDFRYYRLTISGHCCEICSRKEGPIEVDIPKDEWDKAKKEYDEQLDAFKKLTPEECIQGIISGTYIGRPWHPSSTRIIGEIILQIHHKLYYYDKLPWQYSKLDLQILCSDCHKEVHLREIIYTYENETKMFRKIVPSCLKCLGEGYIADYRHRDNGICYACGGAGILFDGSIAWEPVN
jgi:hypothetical protein